jgi:hypothetical protein
MLRSTPKTNGINEVWSDISGFQNPNSFPRNADSSFVVSGTDLEEARAVVVSSDSNDNWGFKRTVAC